MKKTLALAVFALLLAVGMTTAYADTNDLVIFDGRVYTSEDNTLKRSKPTAETIVANPEEVTVLELNEDEVPIAIWFRGKRLVVTTYTYDFSVSSSITSTTDTTTNVVSYFARITMTDGSTKKAHMGWTKGQVLSTPSLTAVTDGATFWLSAPQSTYKAAYVLSKDEPWKIGRVVQTANKQVVVNGTTCFDPKTGADTLDLVTSIPTTTWP